MEEILERKNLTRALKRVEQNKGGAGVDGMKVEELRPYLTKHWPEISELLLSGSYFPEVVKRVEIPEKSGGKGKLGIPTCLDRFIEQAMLQVPQERWDPTFSEASYGFRPGRSAHHAVWQAQIHHRAGFQYVVDMDLEKVFDRVQHDKLMGEVRKRVSDRRVVQLILRFLRAGVLVDDVIYETEEGAPQGGPLSPLLANLLSDELDRELERRGHRFVRYADDCNIYVRSLQAGERVLESVTRFFSSRLQLSVNEAKSAVGRRTLVLLRCALCLKSSIPGFVAVCAVTCGNSGAAEATGSCAGAGSAGSWPGTRPNRPTAPGVSAEALLWRLLCPSSISRLWAYLDCSLNRLDQPNRRGT
jgi:RNA-directed DNA polymerase